MSKVLKQLGNNFKWLKEEHPFHTTRKDIVKLTAVKSKATNGLMKSLDNIMQYRLIALKFEKKCDFCSSGTSYIQTIHRITLC